MQGNAFIDDCGVALRSFKGFAQKLGGIKDVIKQPDCAKIKLMRKVDSEKIILQCTRDEFDKSDLTFHWESNVIMFNLPARYLSFRHQGRHVDARLPGARAGKPR
jgi:hypothetical protein